MSEPTLRRSRARLAAGAAVALLLAGGGFLAGSVYGERDEAAQPAPITPSTPEEPTEPQAPPLPLPEPPLGRQDLLAAVAAATDAYVAGSTNPESAELVGRQFEIRLPFGCRGPLPDDAGAPLRWSHSADDEVLRLTAKPQVWTDAPWARALVADETVEMIEGFWISRPWSAAEACPSQSSAPQPVVSPMSGETLGIAQFFTRESSRVEQRDGKPYEAVKKVKPEALDARLGFRLVLRGRIVELANGQPIRCHAESADVRPVCLIAAEIGYVAFENPTDGNIIAEWRN